MKIISVDFDTLSFRLLDSAQSPICCISLCKRCELTEWWNYKVGVICIFKHNIKRAVGCKSDALTMYMTGAMPDFWTTLELMLRMADFSWLCLVRCWRLEKKIY